MEQPVRGVLLSLSSAAYNSNQVTREDGSIVFGQLFPGEYFLQSQLKEYKFEPHTQTVTVSEGVAMELEVRCERVAFSAFGRVSTITGQPQSRVRVTASSAQHKETAVTDNQGNYRIRGLRPGETYEVTVMDKEHLLPQQRVVTVTKTDTMNVDFIVLKVASTSVRLIGM